MKVICVPSTTLSQAAGDICFRLYNLAHDPYIGSTGNGIIREIVRLGMQPTQRALDFLSFALSVIAADESCPRDLCSDGWTREIELNVSINDMDFWDTQKESLNSTLNFLTGDIWQIQFTSGGLQLPSRYRFKQQPYEAVCLLSGGMDSLIGALDLASGGQRLMLVSQISKGDKDNQRRFAGLLPNNPGHIQLNHNTHLPSHPTRLHERSQRARSIIFLAYGILAATSLDRYRSGEEVHLYVPENGFISLNIPLTPLRIGSLSTRTTHPVFMTAIQDFLDTANLHIRIVNPYQFKTKGEMLIECQDQTTIRDNIFDSTSCGRYARTSFIHCGRCVPCLVRRAAIRRWGEQDRTSYRYLNLSINDTDHRNHDDVRSMAMAIEQVSHINFDTWAGTALNFAQPSDAILYRSVAERGIEEVRAFLATEGAL